MRWKHNQEAIVLLKLDLIAITQNLGDGGKNVTENFSVLFFELLVSAVGKHWRELDCQEVEDFEKPALGHWMPAFFEVMDEFENCLVELRH